MGECVGKHVAVEVRKSSTSCVDNKKCSDSVGMTRAYIGPQSPSTQ